MTTSEPGLMSRMRVGASGCNTQKTGTLMKNGQSCKTRGSDYSTSILRRIVERRNHLYLLR